MPLFKIQRGGGTNRPFVTPNFAFSIWSPDIAMTSRLRRSKYDINENKSCEVSNHRFLVLRFHSEGDSEGIWPPNINELRRSKYEIIENKSCEVSNPSFFFVFQIHSDTPFGTWVVLKIANLQISMTGRGLRIKSMKLGHFMYQNYLLRKAQS